MSFVGRASLDSAMAWAQKRIAAISAAANRSHGRSDASRNAGVGLKPDPRGLCSAQRNPSAMPFVGRASLDAAMAWAQKRIVAMGAEANRSHGHSDASMNAGVGLKPDPRGLCSAQRNPSAMSFVGRASLDAAMAWAQEQVVAMVTATNRSHGHRGASRSAGVGLEPDPRGLCSAQRNLATMSFVGRASLDAAMAWVQERIVAMGAATNRSYGRRGASRRAGVGLEPDPRGLYLAQRSPSTMSFVGRALLDAEMAWAQKLIVAMGAEANRSHGDSDESQPWAQGRIQERRRRAEARPTGVVFSAAESIDDALRGSSIARRCDGVGAEANRSHGRRSESQPCAQRRIQERGRRAGARPTWVVMPSRGSRCDVFRGSSNSSTLRWRGRSDESRRTLVGLEPDPRGCYYLPRPATPRLRREPPPPPPA
jgi:hypothetical protein